MHLSTIYHHMYATEIQRRHGRFIIYLYKNVAKKIMYLYVFKF